MTETINPKKVPLTSDDIPTKKELLATGKPLSKVSGKVHVIVLKPLFTIYDPRDPSKVSSVKYGIVDYNVMVNPTNNDYANSFLFRGRMYELMVEEYPLYDQNGLPMVFYDINGRKPISVKISDIEGQKRSLFANQVWGKGHTLQNLIASIESKGKGSVLLYIVMLVAGLFGGIILDHFLHI